MKDIQLIKNKAEKEGIEKKKTWINRKLIARYRFKPDNNMLSTSGPV